MDNLSFFRSHFGSWTFSKDRQLSPVVRGNYFMQNLFHFQAPSISSIRGQEEKDTQPISLKDCFASFIIQFPKLNSTKDGEKSQAENHTFS